MKKAILKVLSLVLMATLILGCVMPTSHAGEITDPEVLSVIEQLEAIDTLQEMQNARSTYAVTANKMRKYNVHTTNESIITAHETKRAEYETYISKMFAARTAAQSAYDALTPEQQALIDPALVAKLDSTLDTVFRSGTYSVTPRSDAYSFELVDGGVENSVYLAYESSNHITKGVPKENAIDFYVAPQIPATYILVDTADGKTSWTPDGLYSYGSSNYEVLYCCDYNTYVNYGTDYKRVNIEDTELNNSDGSAQKIRAILRNSYPYVSLDEMKAQLVANGLSQSFVSSLTRSDIIAAVQMSIWAYSNDVQTRDSQNAYGANFDVNANASRYNYPLHDITNELWSYWNAVAYGTTYDAQVEYRVNALINYLCNLPGVEAPESNVVVSSVDMVRADLVPLTDDLCTVGMYVNLNTGCTENDDLTITLTSYSTNADGSIKVTNSTTHKVDERTKYTMKINAKYGDTIKAEVNGTQYVDKDVYLYVAEGGYSVSQTLVGVSSGYTTVHAEKSFTFERDIDMGLRIHKTATTTGEPLSDITFNIYNVVTGEGEVLGDVPTEEDIAKYATADNLAASVTTDDTGYAAVPLDRGTYLVIEEHNTEKVLAPVDPFFILIPMPVEKEVKDSDGNTQIVIEYEDILSIYPKNTPPDTPPPPPPPPPQKLYGKFSIIKHDENDINKVLSGAQFQVYRAATEDDTDVITVECDGVSYALTPVYVNGNTVILDTDENGYAISPDLELGVYFIVETKAPDGYCLMEDAITVNVVSNALAEIPATYVPNEQVPLLPETGGSGTTMIIMIGGLLTIISAIVLISRRRMQVITRSIDDEDSFFD